MDALQKLLFQRANVRGETVTLGAELKAAIDAQELPVAARRFAGELACAALLSAGALQFDGTVAIQIEGDGAVRRALAEVRPGFLFRVMIDLREGAAENLDPNADLATLVNATGRGRCAFILDRANRPVDEAPYQGIVALEGKTFAEALEAYFIRSEQVETKLALAADESAAGGILLQKLPGEGGKLPENYDPEGWQRVKMFADTVKSAELLTLEPAEINRRLFWEEAPLVTLETAPKFACTCSSERFDNIIRSLGAPEAEEIVKEQGGIDIRCSFCGRSKHYDGLDVKALFANAAGPHEA
ncbi:Hsp33 family molecular chaperone HslO [Sutterella sp.]|uniref:Hsp33 family molecular chaperone HslO n=1 Tax=Sutterella sp. TaxID=1981025 RepID=UPI0026DF889E|nr:Hsp33 family molecular chaperone HslO [Sutterella sp.]MDO5531342.1 Hsp33 family molecular chaperone HslO [Sutterella sp.]